MTKEEAILIAAGIAATASIVNLVFTLWSGRQTEIRKCHRNSLEPHITEISRALHEIVATSSILTQGRSKEGIENWREKAKAPKENLKKFHVELRYSLWSIRGGLRTISRLPDWIEHFRGFPEYEQKILRSGKRLANALDWSIMRSYTRGRPPTAVDSIWVWYRTWRLNSANRNIKRTSLTKRSRQRAPASELGVISKIDERDL